MAQVSEMMSRRINMFKTNNFWCFFRSFSITNSLRASTRRPGNIMDSKIEMLKIEPLTDKSPYVKPLRIHFKQNDVKQAWDCVITHDSVSILIYNRSTDKVVLVRQFRPAIFRSVLMKDQNDLESFDHAELIKKANELPKGTGFTIELCSGIIDKEGLSVQKIAQEEVIEETGFHPPLEAFEFVLSYRSAVGTSGSLSQIYFCEVDDSMKVSKGGGVGSEVIDVIEMDIAEVRKLIYTTDASDGNPHTSPGMRLSMSWFIHEKYPTLKKN